MNLVKYIKSIRTGTVVGALMSILISLLLLSPFIYFVEWWNTSTEYAKSYWLFKAMIFAPLLAIIGSIVAPVVTGDPNGGLVRADQWLHAAVLKLSISLLATGVFFVVVPDYQEEKTAKVEQTPAQKQWGDCYEAGRQAVWLDRPLASECRGHPGAQQGIREELMKQSR